MPSWVPRAGRPVVLLHGVPENLQGWYAAAPMLAETYHVFALDWPGFGGSDPMKSPEAYTSRRFADVVVDFMDTLRISQALPRGHRHRFASVALSRVGPPQARVEVGRDGRYSVPASAVFFLGA